MRLLRALPVKRRRSLLKLIPVAALTGLVDVMVVGIVSRLFTVFIGQPNQPPLPFQNFIPEEPKTKEEKKTTQDFSDMVLQAVVDEDYKMGLQIQSNISKLESHNFVYGKNDPAVQNYHKWIDKFMNKEDSNW